MEDQLKSELSTLFATAAQTRLRVIESQLSLGFTFCQIAATEIRYHEFAQASEMLQKVRRAAEAISAHLDEENHAPAATVAHLRSGLAGLTKRADEILEELRSATSENV